MEKRNLIVEFIPEGKQKEQVEEVFRLHKEGTRKAKFLISAMENKEVLRIYCEGVKSILMEMEDAEIRASLLEDPRMERYLIVHQFLKERDTYLVECSLMMPPKARPWNRDISLTVEEIEDKVTPEELAELESLIGCEAIELRLEEYGIHAYYNGKDLGEADGYQTKDVENFIKMGFDVWANVIFLDVKYDGRIDLAIRAYANVVDFSEIDVLLKEYPIEHIDKAFLLLHLAGLSPNSDEWDILTDDAMSIDREKLKNLPSHKHPRVADSLRDRMCKATATNPTNPEFQMGVPYDFDIYGITWDDIKVENKDLILKLLSDNYILALFIRMKRKNFATTLESFIEDAEPHFGPLTETVKKRIERFNNPYGFR